MSDCVVPTVVLLLVLVLAFALWVITTPPSNEKRVAHPLAPAVVPANSIFHKPINADCPTGTSLLSGYFTQADGTKLDACYNPKGDGSIDYLNPGEGATIGIILERPRVEDGKLL